jgi:hypothetical protein
MSKQICASSSASAGRSRKRQEFHDDLSAVSTLVPLLPTSISESAPETPITPTGDQELDSALPGLTAGLSTTVLCDTFEEEDGDARSMEGWDKDGRVFQLPVQGMRVHSYQFFCTSHTMWHTH